MIGTPLTLEVLMHYYCSEGPHRSLQTKAGADALEHLVHAYMLEPCGPPGHYKVTDKARAYIKYILNLPFPECQWVIPAGEA